MSPQGLPAPVLATAVNVALVSGTVLVELPGHKTFQQLTAARQLRVGSVVDTRRGRVRITIAGKKPGALFAADFYGGVFKITQLSSAIASMRLVRGSFRSCTAPPRRATASAARNKHRVREIRHLWASGSGPFRTVGRYSAATVRGTTWRTADRCDGTQTRVTAGKVVVRDFVKGKSIVLGRGRSYLAKRR